MGCCAIIDFDKINNWKEIKGQSTWINVAFKDQKEINNNGHLCFPFATKSLKVTSAIKHENTADEINIYAHRVYSLLLKLEKNKA